MRRFAHAGYLAFIALAFLIGVMTGRAGAQTFPVIGRDHNTGCLYRIAFVGGGIKLQAIKENSGKHLCVKLGSKKLRKFQAQERQRLADDSEGWSDGWRM